MDDFLELVQRLHAEAALEGTAPSTVADQSGMALNLVNWINTAYANVWNLYESWLFRRGEFSFSTTATTSNYTPSAAGISDLSSWFIRGVQIYSSVADESDLIYMSWDDFRMNYRRGTARSETTRPSVFSIKPDRSMELYPIPNAVFNVNGEYIMQADVLSENADVPVFDDQHRMIIVWGALMLYGASEGAPAEYIHGQNEYERMIGSLELEQLPKPHWGPSLV